jgi:transposase
MGRQRRSFSDEYKRDAVRRLADGKQGLTQIARDLGIHPNLLDAWRRKFGKSVSVSRASISASSLEEENARLRRENAALKEDREILKKAAAFFAKESR